MINSVRTLIAGGLVAGMFLMDMVAASAATRVALLNGDGSPQVAQVVDLAQSGLSREPSIELLDRAHIRQVLEEQKRTVLGIVDSRQAIEVGKLLKVDLVAVVESSPAKDKDNIAAIVIFDSRTGVRYWDAILPNMAKELETAVEQIVIAVKTAIHKREGRSPAFHTVSVMTIRNADLPREQDGLCETVGILVERGLCRSPDLAVLERRRASHVNEERELPGTEPSKDLLPSLTTIDLEIARGVDGRGLKATGLLKTSGKETTESITVAIPERNAALLAETLLGKLTQDLRAAPATMGDPKSEARRFDVEAVHHYSHQRYADSVRAAEASWALDPTNEDVGERLCLYLIRYATYLFWPERINVSSFSGPRAWMDAQVDDATLDSLLTKAGRALEIHANLANPSINRLKINQPLGFLGDRLRGFRNGLDKAKRDEIDDLLQSCRKRSLVHIERLARTAVSDANQLDNYGLYLLQELKVLQSCSIDTEQYAQALSEIVARWLEVTRNWQPKFNRYDGGAGLTMLLSHFVGPYQWAGPLDEQMFARTMASQHAAMRQHVRPIVQLFGMLAQIRGDVLLGVISEEEGYRRFGSDFRKLAQDIVTSPEPWDAERTRFAVYESWADLIDMMPGKTRSEFMEREATAFCEFMLGRFELHGKVFGKGVLSANPRKRVELFERGLLVIDSPRFSATPETKTRMRNEYRASLQQWQQKIPQLATNPSVPWSKANLMFDIGRFRQLLELDGLTVQKDDAYVLATQIEGQFREFHLLRVPLSGGDAILLSKTDLKIPAAIRNTFFATRFVTSMCVENETLYVATDGAGIVIFPLGTGSPSRIGIEDGLPTNNIRSVAVMDGKLYAGVSDGYLVAYDLAEKRCDVLASSRRKQKHSPFDDRKPFQLPTLLADPAQKRIVFVVDDHLWQLTPADGRFTRLFNIIDIDQGRSGPKLTSDGIIWTSPVRNERFLISDMTRTIEIDLSRNQGRLLHSPDHGVFQMTTSQLVVDGFLWSGSPFARLSLDKHEYTRLPAPDQGPEEFISHIGLEMLGNGKQILAANSRTIWRLDLEANSSSSNPSGSAISRVIMPSVPVDTSTPKTQTTPPAKGTVRAMITTEDQRQLDPDKCRIQFQSFRIPQDRNTDTVYRDAYGLRVRLNAGQASAELPPGMISLGIFAPGYAPVAIGLRELKQNETLDLGAITLRRGFDWKLTIRNDNNHPVANAEITAVCRYSYVGTTALSNSDGVVVIPNAAEEEYTLMIRAPGHQPNDNVKLRANPSQAAAVNVLRAKPTSGRVIDEKGQPVQGARLLTTFISRDAASSDGLTPGLRELATTDADGRFTLDQLSDDVQHQIRIDLNGKTRIGLTDVVCGQTDLEWKLKPLIHLSGKVVGLGPNDARRMKYTQSIVDSQGRVAGSFFSGETSLDAEGRFQINDLIPGVIRLEGFHKFFEVDLPKTNNDYVINLNPIVPSGTTSPSPTSAPQLESTRSRESSLVAATIVTEDGVAPDGFAWLISRQQPYTNKGETFYASSSGASIPIVKGRISHRVAPGVVSLGIFIKGFAPAAIGLKEVKPDESVDFGTVTLRRGFTFKIAVRDENDHPVPNAELAALCRFGNLPSLLTSNSDGEVQLTHAANEMYSFVVRAPGHQPLRDFKLQVRPGETGTIVLRKARPTSGLVIDENDKPVVGARIRMLRDHIESFYPNAKDLTKTDGDGRFVLDQLADGQLHTLRIDVDEKPRLVLTNVEAGKADQVWKLQPSLTLAGRILGISDNAERNIRFDQRCLNHAGVMSGSFFSGATRVGPEGNFTIEGLLPGRVTLLGFGRYTDIDLSTSQNDYVLDLNAPDPSKPNAKVKLAFVQDGKPVLLKGRLKELVSQTNGLKKTSISIQLLTNQSSVDIAAFAPGKIHLIPDELSLTEHFLAEREFDVKVGQTTVEVELLPAGSISGVVHDNAGEIVANADVIGYVIRDKKQISIPQSRTNEKGEFTLGPVPFNASTSILVKSGQRTLRSETITLNSDEMKRMLQIKVSP